jgi:pimeloyl-ACP methyl ester carboxylesterase
VLRFDDRGVGQSTGDFASGTEWTRAADVEAALALLRSRRDIDDRHLGLLGHSEGARVVMLVAAEDTGLAAIALLAGAANPRAAARYQVVWALDHTPQRTSAARDSVLAAFEQQADSLARSGRRELYRWDADALARQIHVPVGIFQGANDRQVPADQAEALAEVFRRAGNGDVTVKVIPGVNHLFVPDPTGDFQRYHELKSGRLDPVVLAAIREWGVAKLGGLR